MCVGGDGTLALYVDNAPQYLAPRRDGPTRV